MDARTANFVIGAFVLTPILLGLWLGLRAIVRIRSKAVKGVFVIGVVFLLVYPPIRVAIAVPAGELLCAAVLTAAIVILHRRFGEGNPSNSDIAIRQPVSPSAETPDATPDPD